MKQKDLKNKLDQIDHDFNQEALWSKINTKQKKKRRGFFWLIPIGGLLVIAMLAYSLLDQKKNNNEFVQYNINNKLEDNTETHSTNSYIKDQTLENQKVISIVENSEFEKKQIETITNAEYKIEKQSVIEQQQAHPAILNNKQAIRNDKPIMKNDGVKADVKVAPEVKYLANNPQESRTISIAKETNLNGEIIVSMDAKVVNELELLDLQLLALLSPNIEYAREPYFIKETNVQPELNIPEKEKSLMFGIKGGIGFDFHAFREDTLSATRNKYERSLEALSFGVFGKKRFSNKIILEGNLHWTRSQTIAQRYESSSTHLLVQDSSFLIREWEKIEYVYYNEYYRIDARVGVGYSIDLSSDWSIEPMINLGYTFLNYQNGEYWNRQLNTIPLTDAVEYKASSSFNIGGSLGIHKFWNGAIETGLIIGLQSTRSLTKENYYQHRITPLNFQVSVAKRI